MQSICKESIYHDERQSRTLLKIAIHLPKQWRKWDWLFCGQGLLKGHTTSNGVFFFPFFSRRRLFSLLPLLPAVVIGRRSPWKHSRCLEQCILTFQYHFESRRLSQSSSKTLDDERRPEKTVTLPIFNYSPLPVT